MKKFRYEHATALVFLAVVIGIFGFNVKETASNINFDTGVINVIKSVVKDVKMVDSVKYPFININGGYQALMQRHYIYDADSSNDIMKTKDGYLLSTSMSKEDTDNTGGSVDSLAETRDCLSDLDIPMVYVLCGTKAVLSPERLHAGLPNIKYNKVEQFLNNMEAKNIDFIDTRKAMNLSMDSFYKTDHHWKNETAIKVSEYVCTYLNKKYGLDLDEEYYGAENFRKETYENSFLGAEGRRTGIYYTGLDDFSLYYPDFDTDFDVTIENREGDISHRKGPYEDSILDKSHDLTHYDMDDSAYYVCWGGDYGIVHVNNNKLKDGASVFIIKDSYGIPVSCFMTSAFKSMDVLDVRYYGGESIREEIRKADPDAVIYLYGTGYLDKSYMFKID